MLPLLELPREGKKRMEDAAAFKGLSLAEYLIDEAEPESKEVMTKRGPHTLKVARV